MGLRRGGDVGDARGGDGDDGGGQRGDETACLRERAGEDGFEGELVDVAVVVGRAGDFVEGSVGGAVGGGGGEDSADRWDEGVVQGGPARLGLGDVLAYPTMCSNRRSWVRLTAFQAYAAPARYVPALADHCMWLMSEHSSLESVPSYAAPGTVAFSPAMRPMSRLHARTRSLQS